MTDNGTVILATTTTVTGIDVAALVSAGGLSVIGGPDAQALILGPGNGTMSVSGIEGLTGSANTDIVFLGGGGNTLAASGIELLIGGAETDLITVSGPIAAMLAGNGGADVLAGGAGDDTLFGGVSALGLTGPTSGVDGDDTLAGGGGGDLLIGGVGSDTALFDLGASGTLATIAGGAGIVEVTLDGMAVLRFSIQTDLSTTVSDLRSGAPLGGDTLREVERAVVRAGAATLSLDLITSPSENLTIVGTAGNDRLGGGSGHDTIAGNAGNDTIDGFNGDDRIDGGDGNDRLAGGSGADTLTGGVGNDTLAGNSFGFDSEDRQSDVLDGGDGDDLLRGYGGDVLRGGEGRDTLSGWAVDADQDLDGGAGDDQLSGRGRLLGGDGSDSLTGSGLLDGGSGDDVLRSDGGDTLTGGLGADRFVLPRFSSGQSSSADLITDFQVGNGGDVLDIAPLQEALRGYAGENPFGSWLRFVQDGADSLLQIDIDGTGSEHGFTTIARLQGVSASAIVAANIAQGFSPAGDPVTILPLVGTNGGDTLAGGFGSDTISGEGGNDSLSGGFGNDRIEGGDGDDTLTGGTGSDTLAGGIGNDSLSAGDGNDSLSGGDGNDSLVAGSGKSTLSGGGGNDTLLGGLGGEGSLLDGGDGNDSISGGTFDTITGGVGDDRLSGSWVLGGEGNDALDGYGRLDGGSGDDTLRAYGAEVDSLTGGAGSDRFMIDARILPSGIHLPAPIITDFQAGVGGDLLDFSRVTDWLPGYVGGNPFGTWFRLVQDGADTLVQLDQDGTGTNSGFITVARLLGVTASAIGAANVAGGFNPDGSAVVNLSLSGTSGDDSLTGGGGNDTLSGGGGNDTLSGGIGNDIIIGDDGNDTLSGDSGIDSLFGGAGNDVLLGSASDRGDGPDYVDVYDGGAGNDIVNAAFGGRSSISGGDGDDTLYGWGRLDGGAGNDLLRGHTALFGGAGDDVLHSEVGMVASLLDGGAGNDTLTGNRGQSDTLTGGGGRNRFVIQVYRSGDSSRDPVDLITDFRTGPEGDQLDLDDIVRIIGDRASANPFGTHIRLVQDGADTLLQVASGSGPNVTFSTPVRLQGVTATAVEAANVVQGFDPRPGVVPTSAPTGVSARANGSVLTLSGVPVGGLLYVTLSSDVPTVTANALPIALPALPGTISGVDTTGVTGASAIVRGGAAAETFILGGGNDDIQSGDGGDLVSGGAGNDTIAAGNGDDTLTGGAGDDRLSGDLGSDRALYTLTGVSGALATVSRTDGSLDITVGGTPVLNLSRIVRTSEVKVVDLRDGRPLGSDTLAFVEQLTVSVEGQSGAGSGLTLTLDPVLLPEAGADGSRTVTGTPLSDYVNLSWLAGSGTAGGTVFRVDAGAGHDRIYGNDGDSHIVGGAGEDTLEGGGGYDVAGYRLEGGAGPLSLRNRESVVEVTVGGTAVLEIRPLSEGGLVVTDLRSDRPLGADILFGIEELRIDAAATGQPVGTSLILPLLPRVLPDGNGSMVVGTAFDDRVTVGTGGTHVTGAGGADPIALFGDDGSDSLTGHAGANILEGGTGDDTIDGGAGIDTAAYVFDGLAQGLTVRVSGNDNIELLSGPSVVLAATRRSDGTIQVTDTRTDGPLGTDMLSGIEMLTAGLRGEAGGSVVVPFAVRSTPDAQGNGGIVAGSVFGDTIAVGTADGLLPTATAADFVVIEGGTGDDTLTGHAGDNFIAGGDGSDVIGGGGGRDIAGYRISGLTGPLSLREASWGAGSVAEVLSGDTPILSILREFDTDRFVVTDLRTGTPLGTDTLTGVESLLVELDGVSGAAGSLSVSLRTETFASGQGNGGLIDGSGMGDAIVFGTAGAYFGTATAADTIVVDGGAGSDRLESTLAYAGRSYLVGGVGSDSIKGGEGHDIAAYRFSGTGALTTRTDGSLTEILLAGTPIFSVHVWLDGEDATITDLRNGSPLGTDSLSSVEELHFERDDGAGGIDRLVFRLQPKAFAAEQGSGGTIAGTVRDDFLSAVSRFSGAGAADAVGIEGDAGNDSISGHGGGNYVDGGAGNDLIDGGGGTDMAGYRFSGTGAVTTRSVEGGVDVLLADTAIFAVRDLLNGQITVTDLRPGSPLGTDTLSNVEELSFRSDSATGPEGSAIVRLGLVSFAGQGNGGIIGGTILSDRIEVGTLFASAGASDVVAVEGGSGNDTIIGHSGPDFMAGGAGNDSLDGAAGDDVAGLRLAGLTESLTARSGPDGTVDVLSGAASVLRIRRLSSGEYQVEDLRSGSPLGTDLLSSIERLLVEIDSATGSGSALDILLGANAVAGEGNGGFIAGSHFDDTISFGPGAETYFRTAGTTDHVTVEGGLGNDQITATTFAGRSYLVGGAGSDTLNGGSGHDVAAYRFDGQGAVTTRTIGGTVEVLLAGTPVFSVVHTGSGFFNVIDLRQGSPLGTDTISGIEELHFQREGGTGDDGFASVRLGIVRYVDTGNSGALGGTPLDDWIWVHRDFSGAGAADSVALEGGDGNDRLVGHAGRNYFDGGSGNDSLEGGGGHDIAGYRISGTGALTTRVVDDTIQVLQAGTPIFSAHWIGQDWTVTDLRTGSPFGTDTLTQVEELLFQSDATGESGQLLLRLAVAGFAAAQGNGGTVAGTSLGESIDVATLFPLAGTADFVAIESGAGNDVVQGHVGPDFIDGGAGNDTIAGGSGTEFKDFAGYRLTGVTGPLTVRESGTATVEVMSGDTALLRITKSSVDFQVEDLRAGTPLGTDFLSGIEEVLVTADGQGGSSFTIALGEFTSRNTDSTQLFARGSVFSDQIDAVSLFGSEATTVTFVAIEGLMGHDLLSGHAGSNYIDGGVGDDTLFGGSGFDQYSGGTGADIFRFTAVSDSTVSETDRILDFSLIDGDRIDLSQIDANLNVAGIQPLGFIGTDAFAVGVKGQLRYTIDGQNTLVQADVDGDGTADLQIVLTGAHTLTTGAFIL